MSNGWAQRARVGRRISMLLSDLLEGLGRDLVVRRLRTLADELEATVGPEPVGERAHPLATELVRYWRKVMDKPRAKVTKDRVAKVKARLTEGYSPDEIRRAIDGCAASHFHQGDNDRGKLYNDITLICRNGSTLERFRDEVSEGAADVYSELPSNVVTQLRDIEREADEALSKGEIDDYSAAQTRLRELRKAHGVDAQPQPAAAS